MHDDDNIRVIYALLSIVKLIDVILKVVKRPQMETGRFQLS